MKQPVVSKQAHLMPGAQLIGEVEIAAGCSVWPNAVLRGDSGAIRLGERTNVQDCSVVHSEHEMLVSIGKDVTIGHSCIIHGCRIGDNTLIGMGSIVMDQADIGNNCLIGAGSLVTGGTVIPDGSMAFGRPAKVVRPLTQQEIQNVTVSAQHYKELAQKVEKSLP